MTNSFISNTLQNKFSFKNEYESDLMHFCMQVKYTYACMHFYMQVKYLTATVVKVVALGPVEHTSHARDLGSGPV